MRYSPEKKKKKKKLGCGATDELENEIGDSLLTFNGEV